MIYDQKSADYNFKFNFFFPLLWALLIYILSLLGLEALSRYFNLAGVNIFARIFMFLILIEAVFSVYLRQKMNLSYFVFLIELVLCWGGLKLFTQIEGVIFWVVFGGIIWAWFNVRELSDIFSCFIVDYEEILSYDSWEKGWLIEDYKTGLVYHQAWERFMKKVFFINIILIISWIFLRNLNLFIILITVFFLGLEFVLVNRLYFFKKTLDWRLEQIKFSRKIKNRWFWSMIILLIGLILFTVVLPIDYLIISRSQLIGWLNSISGGETIKFPEMKFSSNPGNMKRNIPQDGLQQQFPPFLSYILWAFIIISGGTIITIIVGLILSFICRDLEKINSIPAFFINIFYYFKKVIQQFWLNIKEMEYDKTFKNWGRHSKEKNGQLEGRQQEIAELEELQFSLSVKKFILKMYRAMIKLLTLSSGGKDRHFFQTPYEYFRELAARFPGVKKELKMITDIYVELIYSSHNLETRAGLKKQLIKVWQSFRKKMNFKGEN